MAEDSTRDATANDTPPSGVASLATNRRLRGWTAAIFVVLTSLAIAIATISVWTHNTLFDTDQFMEVVEPALSDPALAEALSERVTDEVLEALDLEARIADTLDDLDAFLAAALFDLVEPGERLQDVLDRLDRPTLGVLSPPITENLETRIADRIDALITSERFRTTLVTVVRETHRAAVAVVQGDVTELPNVYTQDGDVRLNLLPIVRSALEEVWTVAADYLPDITLPDVLSNRVDEATAQLAEALGSALPDDFGQVTLMSEDQLNELESYGQRANRLVVLLVVLALVLLVATLVISPARRRTLIQLAIGTIAAFVIAIIGIRAAENGITSAITDPNGLRAAEALLTDITDDLRTWSLVVISIAVVVGVAAFLADRPSLVARATGRRADAEASDIDRWVGAHPGIVRAVGLVAVLVFLALTGLAWWSILIAAVVLGGVLLYVDSTVRPDVGDTSSVLEDAAEPSP